MGVELSTHAATSTSFTKPSVLDSTHTFTRPPLAPLRVTTRVKSPPVDHWLMSEAMLAFPPDVYVPTPAIGLAVVAASDQILTVVAVIGRTYARVLSVVVPPAPGICTGSPAMKLS